jgi:hypothetical protein
MPNLLDLLGHDPGEANARIVCDHPVPRGHRLKADDVGLPSGDREHALARGPDVNRRMRALHRLRKAVEVGHREVLAGEGERPGAQEALENLDRLLETVDPDAWRVEPYPGFVILGLGKAGTEPQLRAAVRQHVEGGNLLRQDHRMPIVVQKDEAPHSQLVRYAGDGREGGERRQLMPERFFDEVVSDQEGGECLESGRGEMLASEEQDLVSRNARWISENSWPLSSPASVTPPTSAPSAPATGCTVSRR